MRCSVQSWLKSSSRMTGERFVSIKANVSLGLYCLKLSYKSCIRLKSRLSVYVQRLQKEGLLDDKFQLNPDSKDSIREV